MNIEVITIDNYSPLRYPGGKNKTYPYVEYIVSNNTIDTYIEPYCGGAAVALKLLFNNKVKKIMINDFDRSIYAMWFSILNHTDEFIGMIAESKFTMDEWYRQKHIQNNKENENLLILGFSTFYLNRTNRSGVIKGGPIGGIKQDGAYKLDCRFNKKVLIHKVNLISSKKNKIKLYNKDALEFIASNVSKTRNSFTFFDPPYYKKGPGLYTNFYEHIDHLELSQHINKYMQNKKWILTYDVNDKIFDMYSDYEKFEYYLNYSAGSTKIGLEYIFLSNTLSSANINEYLRIKENVQF